MANLVESEEKAKKKTKNAIDALNDIYPGCVYNLVGQYGAAEQFQMVYVMEVEIESRLFQGIGFSKRKAKMMAAEYALIFLGKLEKLTEDPESFKEEPYCWNDFTADIIDNNSTLFNDFSVLEQEVKNEEDDMDEWIEALTYDGDERKHMIGRNALSILSELHPECTYHLISAVVEKHRVYFVMSVFVDGMEFKGSGPNKKLARARAAREALKTMYKIEFGVLEDGMPVYEGDEQIWKMYKQKLEEQALKNDYYNPITNPIKQLNEFYPVMKITFPYLTEEAIQARNFVAQTCIDGQVFESSGANKKLAKTNLARSIISILKANGVYDKKINELHERKRIRDRKYNEKPKMFDNMKSAVSKLNDLRPELEYRVVAETPLKNTCITAFTVVVHVDDKIHVGVGKNKKSAKLEAAEKALKELGVWDEEDERAKNKSKIELQESDVYQEGNRIALNMANAKKGPLDLMEMAKQNMSRKDVMKLVREQLGLNIPNSNRGNHRNSKRGRDPRSQFDDMLDELDSLVDNILEGRVNRNEPYNSYPNDYQSQGGNRNYPNRRSNFPNKRYNNDGNNNFNQGFGNPHPRGPPHSEVMQNWNAPQPLVPTVDNNSNNNNINNNDNNNMNNSNNINNSNNAMRNANQPNYNQNNQNTGIDFTKPLRWPTPYNNTTTTTNTNNSVNNNNAIVTTQSTVNTSSTASNYNASGNNMYNNPYAAYQPYWNSNYNQGAWNGMNNFMYPTTYPSNTGSVAANDPSYYTGQQANTYDWNTAWNANWNNYYGNAGNTGSTTNVTPGSQMMK